ncbi:MAG: hypothetical protein ACYTEQ_22765 [Planctomycetota bacterium]|jgi:hypothetical protein
MKPAKTLISMHIATSQLNAVKRIAKHKRQPYTVLIREAIEVFTGEPDTISTRYDMPEPVRVKAPTGSETDA